MLSCGVLWLGYYANRSDFPSLLSAYSVAFAGYAFFFWQKSRPSLAWVIALGIALRLLLLFGLPLLSDDVYRFIWDGRLAAQGIHPFAFTPVEIMQQGHGDATLFALLNSPRYFTVYPPVGQGIFWLAAKCCPGNLFGAALLIKSVLFLGEVGTLWAIHRLLKTVYPDRLYTGVALYALNPLVIVETVGNCHFEGMMAGCLVMAMLALHRQRPGYAGIWWAVGVAVKLLPVLFVPLVLGWLSNRRDRLLFFGAFFVGGLLLFVPLLNIPVLVHLASSVRLYFQQFEFNASLYYLFSHISPWFTGWYEGRIMSIVLAEVTVAVILGLSWRLWHQPDKEIRDLHQAMFWGAFVYLIDATTVHPWYVIVPLTLSLGTRLVFPAIWTWSVVLSYSHYHHGAYLENFGLIAVEYAVLGGWMYWEMKGRNKLI